MSWHAASQQQGMQHGLDKPRSRAQGLVGFSVPSLDLTQNGYFSDLPLYLGCGLTSRTQPLWDFKWKHGVFSKDFILWLELNLIVFSVLFVSEISAYLLNFPSSLIYVLGFPEFCPVSNYLQSWPRTGLQLLYRKLLDFLERLFCSHTQWDSYPLYGLCSSAE